MLSRFFLGLLLAGVWTGFASAQETVESVKRQTKAVESETAREKKLHEAEKKRHAEFIEVGRKKVQALAQQNKFLNAEIDSLKAELNKLADARQKTMGTIRWFESRKAKYNESMARVIDSLVPVFESDFPYKNEEVVKSVQEIANQLHKNLIEADDALSRTLEVFYDRIRLGYTTEVYKGFLAVDARNVAGTFLRYGAVASVFVSNDGNDVLWLERTADGGWAWKNVSDDLVMRTVLKDVIKVAEGKSAPKIVTIPVSFPREGK
ncbi:MAG: DUF3450 family protein [Fibrobacteraceae bacterium]|nr:DUF3450 family protein [Fibrobacteraceae bacterium]